MGTNQLILGAILIGGMLFFYWFKQSDRKKILSMFPKEQIVAYTHGVKCFGLQSEPGKIKESSGSILLLKDSIFYKDRFGKREIHIPKEELLSIVVTDNHKGEPTYQKCLAFYFRDNYDRIERVAFIIPHPKQWVDIIKRTFNKDILIKEELW